MYGQKFYGIILRSLYTLLYIEIKNIGLQLHSFPYCYPLPVTDTFSGMCLFLILVYSFLVIIILHSLTSYLTQRCCNYNLYISQIHTYNILICNAIQPQTFKRYIATSSKIVGNLFVIPNIIYIFVFRKSKKNLYGKRKEYIQNSQGH